MKRESDTSEVKSKNNISRKKQYLFGIIWMLLWPILIGILAFLILIILMPLGSAMDQGDGAQGFQIRGYFALFIITLVVVCMVLITLQRRAKSVFHKEGATVLRAYMWSGMVLGLVIICFIPDPQLSTANAGIDVQHTNSFTTPKLKSDSKIISVLRKIGAKDLNNLETKFVSSYDNQNKLGEYQAYIDTTGRWLYGVLTVKRGSSGNDLAVTVAHEYLHHVWYKTIDDKTKEKLTSDLITIYGNDPSIRQRVSWYSSKQMLQPTELFSFYCTESSNTYLTTYILAQCNKYIDRNTLIFQR